MRNDGVEVPAAIQFKRFEASDCPDESLSSRSTINPGNPGDRIWATIVRLQLVYDLMKSVWN